jgi:hypothetical protein
MAALFSGGMEADARLEAVAVAMDGTPGVEAAELPASANDHERGAVAVDVGGVSMTLPCCDIVLLSALRRHIRHLLVETACGGHMEATSRRSSLRSLLSECFNREGMSVPWANVPPGWTLEESDGRALYRSQIDPNASMTSIKPMEDASVVAARVAKSTAASLQSHSGTVQSGVGIRAEKKAEKSCQTPTKAAEEDTRAAQAGKAIAAQEAAALHEKREAERRAAEELIYASARAKALTMEARERARENRSSVAFSVAKGLDALLLELELEGRAADFSSAGFGDDALIRLAEAIDDGDGDSAFAEMVDQVGLRGGSVVKLRRRLLERSNNNSKAAGSCNEGRGGSKGPQVVRDDNKARAPSTETPAKEKKR